MYKPQILSLYYDATSQEDHVLGADIMVLIPEQVIARPLFVWS